MVLGIQQGADTPLEEGIETVQQAGVVVGGAPGGVGGEGEGGSAVEEPVVRRGAQPRGGGGQVGVCCGAKGGPSVRGRGTGEFGEQQGRSGGPRSGTATCLLARRAYVRR
ncbi:hypothetical protein T261_1301 [Streptomyces lydicus]|nr:hypothetical protein T261_1301 [Streptomyces lydicus]